MFIVLQNTITQRLLPVYFRSSFQQLPHVQCEEVIGVLLFGLGSLDGRDKKQTTTPKKHVPCWF